MKIKFIAADIDGTLLNSKGELTLKTREAIHRVWKDGIVFAISTGRPIQGVLPLVEEIGLDLPLITYNGSMVLTAKTREVLYERVLVPEGVRQVYELGLQWDVTMLLWSENQLFTNRMDERAHKYSGLTGTPLQPITQLEPLLHKTTKILWYDDVKRIEEYETLLPQFLNNEQIVHHTSRPYFLEFVDREASKAIAIEQMITHYGIKREEVMAIGDGYNDVSMIRYAGLGVAMGNAPEDIKQGADRVTASCDEDGVAQAIEKYVYGGPNDEGSLDHPIL